ncbi:hypothetical protein [Hyalangium gracile]|uniref:hypothetical protein n=1 Tax=Hyalangium gracile TaxID=394092 RepID=UPI001CCF97E7|nr:hypothetical protein [Hyalangium gracile]
MAEVLVSGPSVEQAEDPLLALTEVLDNGSLQAAVEARDLGESLEKAVQAIKNQEKFLTRLELLAEWMILLAAHLEPAGLKELSTSLKSLRDTVRPLENDLASQERLREIPDLFKLAEAYARPIEVRIHEAWGRYLRREFSPRDQLAGVLMRFSQHADLARRLRATAKAALALESHFPAPEAREALKQHLRERDAQLQELEKTGTDKKIIEFLLRAAEGKATLAHVNSELLEWLSEQNALDFFLLSLKSAS